MARFSFVLALAWSSFLLPGRAADAFDVQSVPNPRSSHGGWVSDQAGILGATQPQIEQRFERLQQDTGHEVALVILPSIGAAAPRVFANELFKHWGIGRRGEDDGVLILHVLDQRRLEIETGYGAESPLPDAKCAWLVNEVAIPLFRDNQLAQGHLALAAGVDAALRDPALGHDQLVANALGLAQTSAGRLPSSQRRAATQDPSSAWRWLLALFGAVIVVQLLRRRAHEACHRGLPIPAAGPRGFLPGLLVLAFLAFCESRMLVPKVSIVAASALTFALTAHTLYLYSQARRRFARRCSVCDQAMALLDEQQTLQQLTSGQQTEYRLGSVWYRVFRCANGHGFSEQSTGAKPLPLCRFCGFQTEWDLGSKVVQPTPSADGREEHRFACHHCSESRSEVTVLPYRKAAASSSSSSDSSSSSSSWSSSSSSSSSSSFGGGSSGGGGAGGSY